MRKLIGPAKGFGCGLLLESTPSLIIVLSFDGTIY